MAKYCLHIILFILLLFSSCGHKATYRIEGELSNLEDLTIFAVFENENVKHVDTLVCDEKGRFLLEEELQGFNTVTFFMDGKMKYFVVYLEPEGNSIKVKGNALYPGLMEVKGNRINEELTALRKDLTPLLSEYQTLRNKITGKNKKNGIEEADFISRQANIRLQIMEKVFAYIKENPKEKASAILIQRHFLDPDDSKKLDELLAGLDSSLSDFYVVRALRQYSEKIKRTELGAQAPDFTAKNIYGENVKLSNYSGRYLLLAFTAPWCDMCHTEDLFLDKVKQNYSKDKLDILMVSLDDDSQEVRNAVESDSIQWNIVTDSASQTMMLMDLYNVSTLPRCFLIDKEGKIILKTDNGIEIRKTLDNLSLK